MFGDKIKSTLLRPRRELPDRIHNIKVYKIKLVAAFKSKRRSILRIFTSVALEGKINYGFIGPTKSNKNTSCCLYDYLK